MKEETEQKEIVLEKEPEIKKSKKTTIVKEMVYIALFIDLLVICSWINIKTIIPFTLQTLGIMLCLGLLGGKRGSLSIFIYLLMGLIGFPVFASFKSGVAALFGPTGGFLIGFLVMGLFYWLITFLLKEKFYSKIIGIIGGLIIMYVFGTVWFMYVYSAQAEPVTFAKAFGLCVTPFLIPEAIKISVALVIINRVQKYIKL